MQMVWARATSPVRLPALVEKQACARAARAQAAVEAQQARLQAAVEAQRARCVARELRAEINAHRAELRQARNLRLVVVKSTD
jgi:hypothetical protein